ncbi:uncharacterized protein LOC123449552 isoform X2 [Hordeum vulgare subsp. vulgare]|uniref:uncharacterized protein LOC123449552 isoform X2 n=1 Tax=Hordeum vulgare subsp. vulgare TaxID=112509 RepID=UPI001D1A3D52|nr:uncharacterized protein LOC123449552 isoform X2 [Hordeum vulgare subsp. vulgare]
MISIQGWGVIEVTGHSAVVGNKVYFQRKYRYIIVEYNMVEQKLSAIDLIDEEDEYLIKLGLMGLEDDWPELELMGAEDGMLLFATVLEPKLYLWSMEVSLNGAVTWAQRRAIELEPLLPSGALFDVSVVGFAEGVGVIFLSTKAGLYTIELSSGRCKKDSIRYNTITGADDKGFVVPGISTLLSCTGGSSYRNSHRGGNSNYLAVVCCSLLAIISYYYNYSNNMEGR